MEYTTARLTSLGSFASLTLGENGSCLDGNGHNITQLGGGYVDGGGEFHPGTCGPSN